MSTGRLLLPLTIPLQHLHGGLKGVPPLGWGASSQQLQRFGSAQEAEAYAHQNDAGHVLMLLQATPAARGR